MPNFEINSGFMKEANFSQIKFGEDGYVLEVELNEMQQIQREKLKKVVKETVGDYGTYCKGEYEFTGTSLRIKNEEVIIDGEHIFIDDATINDLIEGSKVYLQAWDKEVSFESSLKKYGNDLGSTTVANKIKDVRIGVETSRRYVLSYKLATTSDPLKSNLLLGEVKNSKFISTLDCVNNKPVFIDRKDGNNIGFLNLGGAVFNRPNFSTVNEDNNLICDMVSQLGLNCMHSGYITEPKKIENTFKADCNELSFMFTNLTSVRAGGEPIIFSTSTGKIRLVTNGVGSLLLTYHTDSFKYINLGINFVDTPIVNLYIHFKGEKVKIYANGTYSEHDILTETRNLTASTTCYLLGSWNGAKLVESSLHGFCCYDRALTKKEIEHNISVLNKSKFALSTNNTIAKIEGISSVNYVKKCKPFTVIVGSTTHIELSSSEYIIGIKPLKKYVFTYYCSRDLSTKGEATLSFDSNNGLLTGAFGKLEHGVGIHHSVFTTKDTLESYKPIIKLWVSGSSLDGEYDISWYTITDFESNKITQVGDYGINSTKAIISYNNVDYPIYDPYIYGETKVMKARIGTENWEEIHPYSKRNLTTYKYKLINKNSELGKCPDATDYINRINNTKVINTKSFTISESNISSIKELDSHTDTIVFDLNLSDIDYELNTRVCCDSFKYGQESYHNDIEGIFFYSGYKRLGLSILKSRLTTPDVEGIKAWIKKNPITIQYKLSKPIVSNLTVEEMKSYNNLMEVLELSRVGSSQDTITFNQDGSALITKRTGYYDLDSLVNWTKGNTINPKYIRCYTSASVPNKKLLSSVICTILPDGGVQYGTTYEYENISGMSNNAFFSVNLLPSTFGVVEDDNDSQIVSKFRDFFLENTAKVLYELSDSKTTLIPKELLPSILIDNNTYTKPNYGYNSIGINSPLPYKYFGFSNYPSASSITSDITPEELSALSSFNKPINSYSHADVVLNSSNSCYLSGGFINIPFSLRDSVYVNTETSNLITDLELVIISTEAKTLKVPKSTEGITLSTLDGHNFVLKIPTLESGVGNVYITNNAILSIGIREEL